jgi:hypothetical protein
MESGIGQEKHGNCVRFSAENVNLSIMTEIALWISKTARWMLENECTVSHASLLPPVTIIHRRAVHKKLPSSTPTLS